MPGKIIAAAAHALLLLLAIASGKAAAQIGGATERTDEWRAETFGVGPSIEYASGKFGGAESTEMWWVALNGRFERGPWVARLNLPYVFVSGPGNVVPAGGAGGTPVCRQAGVNSGAARGGIRCGNDGSTPSTSVRVSSSGLGDLTAGLSYRLVDRPSGAFDLTGKVKLPMADESRALGTGEADYSLQGDLTLLLGRGEVFLTAGYRWYGDPPGIEVKDVFFGALGASYRVTQQTTAGIAFDHRQKTYDGGAALNEISLFASYRVTSSARVRGYVFKGLTDGGAGWGGGALAMFTF
jgi:hypothetical protein